MTVGERDETTLVHRTGIPLGLETGNSSDNTSDRPWVVDIFPSSIPTKTRQRPLTGLKEKRWTNKDRPRLVGPDRVFTPLPMSGRIPCMDGDGFKINRLSVLFIDPYGIFPPNTPDLSRVVSV